MWNFGGQTSGQYGKTGTDYKRQVDYWTPEQKKTSKSLYGGVIKGGFDKYPYSGKPTDIEQTALNQLQQFGVQQPSYLPEAGGALSRALTGQGYNQIVDPAAAEKLYSTIQDRTMTDILPEAVKAAATQANVGGMLRSGTGQKLVTDEIGRVARALSEQLATLKYADEQQRRGIAREREGRQLQAIPQTQTLQGAELGRILPGLQFGGMERDIAGTQYNNPLTQLALSYLGLRGKEDVEGSQDTTGWKVGQSLFGGFGLR